jgi:AcrR family transcriptional regulator
MPPRPAAPRRPGRPADSRADQRTRLLDATALLVGRHGVAGTTLAAVARRARVTPALVHYYFGSKAKLVEALFAERIAPVVAQIGAAMPATDGPLPLEAIVAGYLRAMLAAPWLPPILAREVLCEGGSLRARFVQLAGPVIGRLPARVAAAQQAGQVRAGLDPRLAVLSLVSAVVYPVIAGPIWREVLKVGADEAGPDPLARHIAAVLRHGLEPRHE